MLYPVFFVKVLKPKMRTALRNSRHEGSMKPKSREARRKQSP